MAASPEDGCAPHRERSGEINESVYLYLPADADLPRPAASRRPRRPVLRAQRRSEHRT